ncbi:hypothetical protein JIQ42_00830 [Leishmania sp. Namibia]|uniref:hypothetical protein n=1 Tax=Leishmania sp. Namibia TaxID=2802991 RepID=UPI001B48673E|nr:hypothetical protein JIQ42_00830 [Leishmania sp. Namibia]
MSARKLNSAATASSTAPYPPRRRSSGVLSSSTTGSDQSVSAVSLPSAATAVALTVKKSGTKSRTYASFTSLAAPQATVVASSDVHAPHLSAKVLAGTNKLTPVRTRAVAAIPLSRTAPPPPVARESVPSLPLPAAVAAVQHASPLSSSTATNIAGAALRPRGSSSTESVSAPPAAVGVPEASPAAANESSKTGLSTSSTSPPPPTAKPASNHVDANTNLAAAPPAVSVPRAEKLQASGSAPARGLRRLSSASYNSVKGVNRVPGAAATPSTPAPEAAAAHADPIGAPTARQRASAPTAIPSKQNGHLASAAALSAVSTTASGASSSAVAQASLKSSVSSSVIAKRKVLRRAGTGTATSRPPSTATSRRPSLSCTATADSATAPTRDSSVLLPQSRSSGGAAPTLGVESAPSTALNTARTTGPTAANTPTSTYAAVSSSTATRLSRGPVVSEEWARSIIKPGDEKLLYRAAAAAEPGFTRTSSSISMGGATTSSAWQVRTMRSLKNGTQLRRAQETVLRQRYGETPTPGWRSAKAASIGAGSAVSVSSGGSVSRFGSTVKRSGTRLQHRREEGEDRQRSFMAAVATPRSENGEGVGGGCASHLSTAVDSASPTPSRISDISINTVKRGSSRLSGGGARPLLEQSTGCTPMPTGLMVQRRSPSLTLFAKPSPRMFSTPSPRGSFRGPELKNILGVSSGPYCAGNEELTRLTSVREEMLHALMHSAPPPAASAAAEESSAAPAAASAPTPNDEGNADVLEGSAPLLLAMNVGAQAHEIALVPSASPSTGTQSRQRVYSVDLRSGASIDKSAVADTAQPRWRFATGGVTPILASSIRQQPGNAVFRPPPEPPGAAAEAGATSGLTSARPTLDSSVLASGAPHAASQPTPRQLRRPAVMVKLSSLQSPNVVAERVRLELVRHEQQQLDMACSGQAGAAARPSKATAGQLLTATSIEAEARRLLLDPFFPLISEENYQRLVLQNNEYKARKELLASIRATQTTAAALSHSCGSPPPVPPLNVGAVPRAARALEMDLAEADEPVPARPLTAAALASTRAPTAAAVTPLSPSATLASAAITGSTPPRRPSVQYGGPVPCATFSPPRATSPSSNTSNLTSPTAGSATALGGATAFPARDGKLHMNAVIPSEKLGSIKSLTAGAVWYAASESTAPSAAQPFLNASLLASTAGGVEAGGTSSSPTCLRSTSSTPSCSSSRNVTRRSSLLRNAQQHPQLQTTATVMPSRSHSTDDEDSTASDEAVDLAEGELYKALPHWGPFRTSHAAELSASDAVGQKRATKRVTCTAGTTTSRAKATAANKKKLAHGETASALSSTGSIPSLPSMAPVLSPAMAEELRAYMHVFLKRYRRVDAVVAEEMRPVPESPLALQRAIRHSLRLSNGHSASVTDGEEAVELDDPLDDGSYHSQNVQYVLDLVGSLLQAETSFCEDDAEQTASGAPPSTAAAERQKKQRVPGAELIALVMGRPTPSFGKGMADSTAPDCIRSDAGRAATPQPIFKLRDPELRAVELMFVSDAS